MQKWVENVAKEWVEYPFLVMPTNANASRTLSVNEPLLFHKAVSKPVDLTKHLKNYHYVEQIFFLLDNDCNKRFSLSSNIQPKVTLT